MTSSVVPTPGSIGRDWERLPKHIFVLSAAGKPIFARHGDEQEMVTVFGLLQAVYSIAQDAGDKIRCIMTGKRRIIYFVKESLYFVSVSSTGEPEAVLVRQLQFMYTQILLVLTAKVHDVLRNNFSKDIRDLLGSETARLLEASCRYDITPPCIAYSAVRGMVMDRELRADIMRYVQHCVTSSGAAAGLLLHGESLVAYGVDEDSGLVLNVSDLLLLTHFVGNSSSLKTNEHNWVPICLPTFNSKAYLQAYIANFKSDGGGVVQRPVELSLVLIATSTDPALFKELHRNSERFQKYISQKEVVLKLAYSVEDKEKYLTKFLKSVMGLHFFYLFRPRNANSAGMGSVGASDMPPGVVQDPELQGSSTSSLLPAQCVWSQFEFPLQQQDSQNRTWALYQRISCYLRAGTALPEHTLLKSDSSGGGVVAPIPSRESDVADASSSADGFSDDASGGYPVNIMTLQPSSDHSLAYLVTAEGQIVVGIANADSELLVTFPATLGTVEACSQANMLSRSLRNDALQDLFQTDTSVL